nr:hypothetical protein [Bartonella sp. AR 15-3]
MIFIHRYDCVFQIKEGGKNNGAHITTVAFRGLEAIPVDVRL